MRRAVGASEGWADGDAVFLAEGLGIGSWVGGSWVSGDGWAAGRVWGVGWAGGREGLAEGKRGLF